MSTCTAVWFSICILQRQNARPACASSNIMTSQVVQSSEHSECLENIQRILFIPFLSESFLQIIFLHFFSSKATWYLCARTEGLRCYHSQYLTFLQVGHRTADQWCCGPVSLPQRSTRFSGRESNSWQCECLEQQNPAWLSEPAAAISTLILPSRHKPIMTGHH